MTTLNTETLRDEIAQLRVKLQEGKISNAVARSIILAARFELESLKAEMEAVRLGSDFSAVNYHASERNAEKTAPKLRRVS